MPDPYRFPYLDTSCYIALIKGESGRVGVIQEILDRAAAGEFDIVASTLVIAEVVRARGQPTPSGLELDVLDRFFQRSMFRWVELDQPTALTARQVAFDEGLRPNDAIHAVSAQRGGADVLFTYDDQLSRLSTLSGVRCSEPYLFGQARISP